MPNGIGSTDLPPRGMYCACIDPSKNLQDTYMCKQAMETIHMAIPDSAIPLYYKCGEK